MRCESGKVKSLALPSRVPRPATVSAVLTDLIERHGAEPEAQTARESASLYHRAKYGQVVVLALGGSALLVWPAPVAWGLCTGVGAVLVGVLAAGQGAYYKKHV